MPKSSLNSFDNYSWKFSVKDVGPTRHIMGMKISWIQNRQQLFLSQANYIGRVLERFKMQLAKSHLVVLETLSDIRPRGVNYHVDTIRTKCRLLDGRDGRDTA